MKIKDIILERDDAPVLGNELARITRSAKDAAKRYISADRGALDTGDSKENLRKVRELYGVELVDDFVDVLELPNNEQNTDKQESLLTKDNREQ